MACAATGKNGEGRSERLLQRGLVILSPCAPCQPAHSLGFPACSDDHHMQIQPLSLSFSRPFLSSHALLPGLLCSCETELSDPLNCGDWWVPAAAPSCVCGSRACQHPVEHATVCLLAPYHALVSCYQPTRAPPLRHPTPLQWQCMR